MKQTTISISWEEEKLSTLRLYLDRKGMQVESELEKYLEMLYSKNVPAGVREFFDLRAGVQLPAADKQRPKRPRRNTSAAETEDTEARDNG